MILILFAGIVLCSFETCNGQLDLSCEIEGQIVYTCEPCPVSCARPDLLCPLVCLRPGCGCPGGQIIDTVNNKCVDPKQCPVDCSSVSCVRPVCPPGVRTVVPPGQCCPICDDPCNNHTCPTGSQCKVYEPTGEPFCEPSCDLDNGGCQANETCSLQAIQCPRAPCPPIVQCTPKCPPKCSHEFCSNNANRFKQCSHPSPTIPSCPDSCSTTYCSACYYSDTEVSTPFLCNNICDYPPTDTCLFGWSICLRSYSFLRRIHRGESSDFRCFEYACPQRG